VKTMLSSASGAALLIGLIGGALPAWGQSPQTVLTFAEPAPQDPAAQPPETGTTADDDQESDDSADRVVITGTSIRGVPPTGSNLISVSRDDIETLGAANTPDLLASVPQLNSFNTAPQASIGGFGSFAPGMRGLPANATLPLMNGRRLVAAAANETNPDFPLIPSLALERVEVVADGASAIYGSDAVAGVVNFITRKNFTGLEVSATYGQADEYFSGNIGAVYGTDWGTGSALVAYQYTENDNIMGGIATIVPRTSERMAVSTRDRQAAPRLTFWPTRHSMRSIMQRPLWRRTHEISATQARRRICFPHRKSTQCSLRPSRT
jgi:iron complex outermembrane receptor protein